MSTAATTPSAPDTEAPSAPDTAATAPREGLSFARLALLWLIGANLRTVILALAPVLPTIRQQYGLDETEVGFLTTLPVLLLGLGAAAGSITVARAGARRALAGSLLLVAAASALRGAGNETVLFLASVVLGLAIGIAQPALPSLAKAWFGARVGLSTAIYGNGFIVGEAVAASITLPFLVPLTGSWQGAVALWSLPCVVAVVWLVSPAGRTGHEAGGERIGWSPLFNDARTWRLGLLQGGGSALYFGTNALLPTELHAVGLGNLVAGGLTALNVSQLVAAVIVGVLARRKARARPLMLACAAGGLTGLALIAFSGVAAVVIVGCAIVGIASACCFVVSLVLPAVVAEQDEVHRVAAGMFTIGYSLAFLLPLLGGAVWDASGQPRTALLPGAIGCVLFALALAGRGEKTGMREASRLG